MLPIYIFGNLHCLGMCGPLAMMLGKHKFRLFYFLGRLVSYTIAGTIAGSLAEVLNVVLKEFHIQTITSFVFGFVFITTGFSSIFSMNLVRSLKFNRLINKKLANITHYLSHLMLQDKALSTFLFGFFTVMLPCGQTLLVFSACALSGSFFTGMINGFSFALLTSPSLFLSMQADSFLFKFKKYYHHLIGISAISVGLISLCRGFADLDLIDHLSLNLGFSELFHLVIY